ncbi:hypothetical protein [Flavobacterium koreense]
MKRIEIVLISLLVAFILYFAFYKPNKISIEGNWDIQRIVLDGKQIYPTEVDKYLKFEQPLIINNWSNSILIPGMNEDVSVNYEIKKNPDDSFKIVLSSNEKALNGDFAIKLDTTFSSPRNYKVFLKISSSKTIFQLEKEVNIIPKKPEFPRKGQV